MKPKYDLPPEARKENKVLEIHGQKRVDPYFWMNQRDAAEVLSYIRLENAYSEKKISSYEGLRNTLFDEMMARDPQEEPTYPYTYKDYEYYKKHEAGGDYPLFFRRKVKTSKDILILNVPDMAKGHDYYDITKPRVSPDQRYLAFGVDLQGRRFYNVFFKDLYSDDVLPNIVKEITDDFEWSFDSKSIYYVKQDSETLRFFQVYRYTLGSESEPELIYEEKDPTFSVSLRKSLNEKIIWISSQSTLTSEVMYIDEAHLTPQVLLPREKGHEYFVEDGEGLFLLTNWKAKNFRLVQADYNKVHEKDTWVDLVPSSEEVLLENFVVFKTHIVIQARKKGLTQLLVFDKKTKRITPIQFKDSTYLVSLGDNYSYETPFVRFEYQTMNKQETLFDYDFIKEDSRQVWESKVLQVSMADYESLRIMAKTRDNKEVPISILRKKKSTVGGPLLLYGYGSYGVSYDPYFNVSDLSLVDRGFTVAIAHIRGGSELGRVWYEEGRQQSKLNTFYDFIDASKHLIEAGFVKAGHLYANGGSAGGLLMGSISNMQPGLYRGIIAEVPFVDVLTTMLDESIPLTTSEYDEWGNPNKEEDYNYIKQYSPYDNVSHQGYPAMMITSGYHDSQVQYWEPLKWVAKLRAYKTDTNPLLLFMDMESGHSGASARKKHFEEEARKQAFLFMMEGIK